jgi:mono/diheme cytochrome c family protein
MRWRLSAIVPLLSALAPTADAGPDQDYMLYCMGCHGAEARGVPGKIPPLAGSLARFMRTPEGRDYVLRVPGAANSVLTDAQLAAVLNWLAARYPAAEEPRPAPFTVEEVTRARRTPLANVQERRREVIRGLAASGVAPPAEY